MKAKRFIGKIVLVTGGTSGLGRENAIAFAREGAEVIICGRREQPGIETLEMVKAFDGKAIFLPCDISDSEDVKHLFVEIQSRYGRLDVACNNAAIPDSPQILPTHQYPSEDWDAIYFTNLKGTWQCMKYEIESMLATGGGAIVNIASVFAYRGSEGRSGYIAGSHGIVGLTKTAALEYAANNIRINCVCPGGIASDPDDPLAEEYAKEYAPLMPMKRLGVPVEMAMPVLFLCSAEASFITGVVLPVDGGWSAG
jgi:NAD(P)-dependent dehydrogenase (short-subunit alcohol dehydrogenase family)